MGKPIFSEDMTWEGHSFHMDLFNETDYSKLDNITQVYGFVFNDKRELLVVKCGRNKGWSLPGGKPEKEDKSWKNTLIREVAEETDVEIKDIKPIGYIRSESIDGFVKPRVSYQLRSVAKVSKINKQTVDPASGEVNERKFISQKDFVKCVGWGENGEMQLRLALKILGGR